MSKQMKQRDIKPTRDRLLKKQKNICPLCDNVIEDPALDHQHYLGNKNDGKIRGVLCRSCNANGEGRIMSLLERTKCGKSVEDKIKFLRNLADYLEKDYSNNDFHPQHVIDESKRFSRLPSDKQKQILLKENITPASNSKERQKQFRKILRSK